MSNDVSPPRVNLNEADLETLAGLPGIGEGLAKRIIEYRETVGSFAETVEVVAVPGISEKMYLDFADLVSVSSDDPMQPAAPADDVAPDADPAQLEVVSGSNGHLGLDEEENRALPQPATREDEAGPAEAQIEAQTAEIDEAVGLAETSKEEDEVDLTEAEIEAQAAEVIEPVATLPAAAPQPEPAGAVQPARSSFWQSLLILILGIVGGTVLTLGILYTMNGTLAVDQHSHVRNLNNQVATLTGQNEALRTEIQIMREQVNALSEERVRPAESAIQSLERTQGGLTNRLDGLADDTAGLENQVAGLAAEAVDLTERTTSLESTSATLEGNIGLLQARSDQVQAIVDELEVEAERFDTFLTGLGQLLQALQGQVDEPDSGQ